MKGKEILKRLGAIVVIPLMLFIGAIIGIVGFIPYWVLTGGALIDDVQNIYDSIEKAYWDI